jgi:hypothetical protein
MSNVITFPGRGAAPEATLRNNPSFPPENVAQLDAVPTRTITRLKPERRRSDGCMHTFVFRSYDLIVKSSEADLIRDVRHGLDKAQTKLKGIQEQLRRDREHAAARVDLLTKAEARLSAAIAAAAFVFVEMKPGKTI